MTITLIIITLMVILFSNSNSKPIEDKNNNFQTIAKDIRGNSIQLDSSKTEYFILLDELHCSKCVHQIIEAIEANTNSNRKISFITYINKIDDIYTKRTRKDFLQGKYYENANVYYVRNINEIAEKYFGTTNIYTPSLIIVKKIKLKYQALIINQFLMRTI